MPAAFHLDPLKFAFKIFRQASEEFFKFPIMVKDITGEFIGATWFSV